MMELTYLYLQVVISFFLLLGCFQQIKQNMLIYFRLILQFIQLVLFIVTYLHFEFDACNTFHKS